MAQPAPLPYVAREPQLANTINITPTQVSGNTTSIQTFNVSGLDPIAHQFSDVGQLAWSNGAQSQTSGIMVQAAWVSSSGVLSIAFQNTTGGNLTPVAGYYSLIVF